MYLSRYEAQPFWRVSKKKYKYVVKPSPGMHKARYSIPLAIIIRDILKYAENFREARKIIKAGKILVDKKPRKDPRFAVGLMDVIEIPDEEKIYRVMVDKHGLVLAEIKKEDSDKKLCRIKSKQMIRGGKIQLTLHDGRNIVVDDVKKYKPFDSLLIELPSQRILKHFKFAVGEKAMVIDGVNRGKQGKIVNISERRSMLEKSKVVLETDKKERIETIKEYIMVGFI